MKAAVAVSGALASLAVSGSLFLIYSAPQAHSLAIPDSHPRLYWTPERLNQARAWSRSNPFVPTTNTGSKNYIYDQLLAYIVTGDTAQCTTAINWALSQTIAEERLQRSVSFDTARWFGEQIILTYDWCYDQWTPEQRSTLIDRWNQYFGVIMNKPWGGVKMPESNYFWGYLRNELLWGIATKGDNPEWRSFVDFALDSRWTSAFLPYALSVGRGGVPTEGTEYGPTMPGYMAVPFSTLSLFGRDLLTETNWYREFVYALIYLTTPLPTRRPQDAAKYYQIAPWADCCDRAVDAYFPSASNYLWDAAMHTLAIRFSDTTVGRHAREWLNRINNKTDYYKHIRAMDPGGAAQPFKTLPTDYFAAGPQFFSSRSSWAEEDRPAWLVAQMGATLDGGHGHHDSGSFQFWFDGTWLSKESTGYSERIRSYSGSPVSASASEAHNTLLFNGLGHAGAYPDGAPVTLRVYSGDTVSHIASDLLNSYRSHHRDFRGHFDNPYVKTAIREIVFVKPLKTLIIFDRLESHSDLLPSDKEHVRVDPAAVVKTFLLHTETAPIIAGATATAEIGGAVSKLTALVPNSPTLRVIDEGNFTGRDARFPYQFRTEIETSGSAQSYFLNVLQARDSAGADIIPTLEESPDEFTVTLAQANVGTAIIVLKKGMSSRAGLFGFAAAGSPVMGPLGSGVDVVSVTNNGPVWIPRATTPSPTRKSVN